MRIIHRTSLALLIFLLGVLACALPVGNPLDQSALGTAVAETMAVIIRMTQEAGSGVSLDFTNTPTLPITGTLPATLTFTPTVTASATPTVTPLPPMVAMISVSVPTNCRVGPGKAYRIVGGLQVGEVVQVYGRSSDGDYWYIRNPDAPSDFCWVWGEYAALSGPTWALPIFTPPPTPTPTYTATPAPAFEPSYAGLDSCSGWWVDVLLKNTGTLTFRSVSLTVKDTVTKDIVTTISDGFTDRTGCSTTVQRNSLAPGKSARQSSPKFAYNPAGHKLRATITLCGSTGLNGRCVTDTFTFVP